MNSLRLLLYFVEGVFADWTTVSRRMTFGRRPRRRRGETPRMVVLRTYGWSLVRSILFTILIPIPILVCGIAFDWNWLLLLAVFVWFIFTLILAFVSAPMGLFIDSLIETADKFKFWPPWEMGWLPRLSGKRYVKFIAWIYIAEIATALALWLVPFERNLRVLPGFILAAALLAALAVVGSGAFNMHKLLTRVGVLVLVFVLASIFAPNVFRVIGEGWWKKEAAIATAMSKGVGSGKSQQHVAAPAGYPICPDAEDHDLMKESAAVFHLRMDCLSGEIILPTARVVSEYDCRYGCWDFKADDIHQFHFRNGEIWKQEDIVAVVSNPAHPNWIPRMPYHAFRMLGNGTITFESELPVKEDT